MKSKRYLMPIMVKSILIIKTYGRQYIQIMNCKKMETVTRKEQMNNEYYQN